MSEQTPEAGAATAGEPEVVELPTSGDAAFGALMDVLAPDQDKPEGEAGAAPAAADAAAAGSAAAPAEGAGAAGADAAAPALGADGKPVVPADGGAAGADATAAGADAGGTPVGGALPEDWTQSVTDVAPRFGELSTALEDKTAKAYQAEALAAAQKDHAPYFEALDKHPRLLIGQEVPAIGKEGTEVLRDSKDAAEWQEAVKSILVSEVRDRASRLMEDSSDFLATIHQSIELFQNNTDLVPRTKEFDVELANEFSTLVKPYEIRHEGKLQGYSIQVQPLIDKLRKDLTARRATAAPAAAAAPSAASTQPRDQPTGRFTNADGPQGGIQSKAGTSGDEENYDALFGTIGLSGLRI